jgi:hypothetical protein
MDDGGDCLEYDCSNNSFGSTEVGSEGDFDKGDVTMVTLILDKDMSIDE